MATRAYDFDSGVETPTAPTTSAPTSVGDIAALGAKTTFTLANNQALANITALSFDKTVYRMFILSYCIYRSASGGSTRAEAGFIIGVTDGSGWEISITSANVPNTDDAGVDFSITSAGQMQYVSDDNGGSYSAANSIFSYELIQLMGV
jgi:hypothetical protein